ncbi:MAG: glycosyltransferase, partial [Gammaproteobacteria bacterium]
GTRHRITFIPDPVAWTEAPSTARVLGRQRDRWHRGLAEVLWRHRSVLCNPRYRAMGLIVFPYFVLVELLAPVVEVMGLAGIGASLLLGIIDVSFAILFFAVAYGYGVILSAAALALDELGFHRYERLRDRVLLTLWAVLEPLGYRQLTVVWRVLGLVKFLRKRKDWGVMERRGFAVKPAAGSSSRPKVAQR